MPRVLPLVLMCASLALSAPLAHAESHNPADYPLRIHIYRRDQTTFYHNRQAEEAKGEGRANLFEGSEPKGVDFQYECDTKLQTSSGYETFPAKWKKPGQELVILQPQFGKNGYDTCRLKVMVKDFAYFVRNGALASESTDMFKQWMVKYSYDPEHGKDTPTPPPSAAATPAAAAAPGSSSGASSPQTAAPPK